MRYSILYYNMSDIELDEVDQYYESRLKMPEKGMEDYTLEESEDEIMGIEESGSESDDENWGGRKNLYGGVEAETFDQQEEAEELVKESVRLQKKHIEELAPEDYVDTELMKDWQEEAANYDEAAGKGWDKTEEHIGFSSESFARLGAEERENFVRTLFPELYPLSKEFSTLNKGELQELKNKYKDMKTAPKVAKVKFVALLAYLGAITNYFALLASAIKAEGTASLKDHPIMETILSAREAWNQAKKLVYKEDDEEPKDQDNDAPENTFEKAAASSDSEHEAESNSEEEQEEQGVEKSEESEEEESEDDELDASKLKHYTRTTKKTKLPDNIEGEVDEIDADEKKARKKSLRFYTSKIDQQAMKKDARFAGDDDIPYKERLYERQQRLLEEARKRGLDKSDATTNLDDADLDSADEKVAHEVNEYDEFYNSVKFAREDKKKKRMDAHKMAVKAAKEGKLAEIAEEEGTDGKRAINYQIMKNKGLTAKRKKEVRNSRVKKRMKYDKAQKKLKSVRQVYKPPTGAYGGEATGIKKNLTRSVKFK